MSLSKLWGMVKDREAWHAAVPGARKNPKIDEMIGWYQQLNGHGSEQTLGDGEGQGSLACCSPWSHKESDTTE